MQVRSGCDRFVFCLVPMVRRDRLEIGIVAFRSWSVIAIVRDPGIAQSAIGLVPVVLYQVFEMEIGSVVAILSGPRIAQGSIGLGLVSFSRFFREGNEIELEM